MPNMCSYWVLNDFNCYWVSELRLASRALINCISNFAPAQNVHTAHRSDMFAFWLRWLLRQRGHKNLQYIYIYILWKTPHTIRASPFPHIVRVSQSLSTSLHQFSCVVWERMELWPQTQVQYYRYYAGWCLVLPWHNLPYRLENVTHLIKHS